MLTKPLILPTQAEPEGVFATIDSAVNSVFAPFNTWINDVVFWSPSFFPMPWIVMWLLAAGIIITIYLGFIQVRGIKTASEVIRGKFSSPDDPGEIPHYQALTSAVSGTVGLGNIAGVGAAMVIGGPGAMFWMVLAALLGMATKFAECTLGVKYRTVYDDGTVSGGPFKYLPVAFNKFPKFIAVFLTGVYAISIFFFGVGGGNMTQSNQTYSQAVSITGGEDSFMANPAGAIIFGLILAVIIGLVILGGIKSIGKVTSTLVPFMGTVYVIACLIVILGNVTEVPAAIGTIVTQAFNPDAVTGGFIGVLITGLQRAAFSNEAGLGSAPIAHSAVKTRRPVSEGFVALFEPFIDTVIICSMTALTIIIANTTFFQETREGYLEEGDAYEYGGGVAVTSDAFESVIPWFPYILAVAVALFAVSTLITWSYYGNKAWNWVFGEGKTKDTVYRILFLFLTVAGCVLTFKDVLGIADAFLFVCGFVNCLGVYFLLPKIKQEMNEYLADRKSGKLYQLGKADDEKDTAADQI
ncbi:MAG TPA: alanine/glycine:cation symporter family protein [Ornithinimicrobium sp.]|uniref:alanine/glycine:cation symporter family protein n=1 Tax=Ornithinimicrobium sp. TaxID=1977084 RepID=UPI002B49393F|nr:alanine/glycine:cation symporter family protein [Ornithinimicrobium sp.]HKJ12216.1 alanine/glycine:cation symporter family protein [Ornithinimicrobium sp.]